MEGTAKWVEDLGDGVHKVRTCVWSPPGDHPVGCGIIVTVKDNKVIGVEGDPTHPITQGRLCPRCIAMDEALYHPDRIMHPMKRDRADRGKDAWEQITWDEALDLIESKVREFWETAGPESILTFTGTGREITMYSAAYCHAIFNSPNYCMVLSGGSCYGPRCTIANFQLGAGYPELDYAAYFPDRYDDPRWELPQYILVWGKNPVYSNPDGFFGHALIDLMKMGSKLIVVDPQLTWIAAHAEYHLQLRPGTDAALAMAMCNVIIQEDLYDHDFVSTWTYGFDDFAACVAEWTPERAAEVCWVDPEELCGAARAFATHRPSSALWGLAIDTETNGVQAGHTFLALCALTGYMDIPGGITLARPSSFTGKWRYETVNSVPDEIRAKRIKDEQGRYSCWDAAGPGPLPDVTLDWLEMDDCPTDFKMSYWFGTNPLACMSVQPKRWEKALDKLEFNVVQDVFMNPSIMRLCDLVLPLSMSVEHEGIVMPHFGRNTHFLGAMNKAVEPMDSKSDVEIMLELGRRLRPELWPWETPEEFFTDQLHTAYDWGFKELQDDVVFQQPFEYRKYETGALRADGKPGFDTPTGLIEFKASVYSVFGEDPLPYFKEPELSPYSDAISDEVKEEFPLVLTTGGRHISMFHSEHRQIPSMRALNPWPLVTIHPDTAAAQGIADGDWVAIENPLGRCIQRACVRPVVDPRVVHAQHAWWYPEQSGEAPNLFGLYKSNVNSLIPHESVGVTGYGAPYKNIICKIYKVDGLDAFNA